jgi:predicted dehydrogenase
MESNEKFNIGIAGLGFGAAVHIPVFQALPGVRVEGITGSRYDHAYSVALTHNIPNVCRSVDELLQLPLDAVIIALPPDQVFEAVSKAIDAHLPIFCEKPLGMNSKEASALQRKANGLVGAVDFLFAEIEEFLQFKSLIDSGKLGKLRHINLLWLTESWAQKSATWSWKTDLSRGGGVSTLLGTHVYFLVEWLLGPISSVSAKIGIPTCERFAPDGAKPAEELLNCVFQFVNGAMCTATIGNANPRLSLHRWIAVFDNGHVVLENTTLDYASGFKLTVNPEILQSSINIIASSDNDGRMKPLSKLALRFVDAVRNKRDIYPDFVAGARVQYLDEVIKASCKSGKTIKVTEKFLKC